MSSADGLAFVTNLAAAGALRGTPILLATLGEIVTERAGVLNLGLEGLLLVGAMTGFGVAHLTGSALLGVAAAMLAGAALAALHALVTVALRADQVVAGLALSFLGAGVASVLGAPLVEVRQAVVTLPSLRVPFLADLPLLGPVLFEQNVIVYVGFALVPLLAFFLHRTRWGLHLRAVGEQPAAADSLGVNVALHRTAAVLVGGLLAGLAGASLSLAVTPGWVDGMTGGQGWIAVALVIFARWDPWRAALGAWLFGAIRRLPLDLQGLEGATFFQDPSVGFFLDMLPYLFTLAVLVAGSREAVRRRLGAPAALGIPFERGRK
jgi:simple sugar transport system permease protein